MSSFVDQLVPGWSKVHDGDVEGVELNKRAGEQVCVPYFSIMC